MSGDAADRERAAALREAGLSYIDIARYMNTSYGVVRGWFDEEFRLRKLAGSRQWKAENKAQKAATDRAYALAQRMPCQHCPNLTGPASAMCPECHAAAACVRRSLVEGMWADGWKRGEINAALGIAPNSPFIFVMRAQRGWDLPHRRSPQAIANIRASHPRLQAMA